MDVFERPILVQGSKEPIFARLGSAEPDLFCANCNKSILVKGYIKSCIVGVGLRCFECSHITWTPSLANGDVFPKPVITLGRKGEFLITSTVTDEHDVVITCDQELDKLHKPSTTTEGFDLTIQNLEKLSLELNLQTGGKFNKHLKSAERSIQLKQGYYRDNPLAWAIQLFKRHLAEEMVLLGHSDFIAICMIQSYSNIYNRWKDHALFPMLAKELSGCFSHSLIQFVIADYLIKCGNNIAFNPPSDEAGQRAADLYMKLSASEKLFIEVKVPEKLEWTNKSLTSSEMKKTIETCLSKSHGQINRAKPGILVIGTTCLSDGFFLEMRKQIVKTFKSKGKSFSGVAGIAVVGLESISANHDKHSVDTSFHIFVLQNPYFFMENPINTM